MKRLNHALEADASVDTGSRRVRDVFRGRVWPRCAQMLRARLALGGTPKVRVGGDGNGC